MEVWGRLRPGTADRREADEPKPAGAADPLEPRVGKEFLTWRRVLEWCLIPLAFILLRFVPPRPITLAQWLLLLVAALLFASPVVLSSYREYVKGQAARSAGDLAVEYRLRLGLTLGEAITPMGDLLGRIAGADVTSARSCWDNCGNGGWMPPPAWRPPIGPGPSSSFSTAKSCAPLLGRGGRSLLERSSPAVTPRAMPPTVWWNATIASWCRTLATPKPWTLI